MLIGKVKQKLSSQFVRNIGWLWIAELVNRIFRLGTTVTLARMFSPQDYGLMAIVYTVYEFAIVFTLRGGIGAKIVQAEEKDVKTICDTSYWLNWILCISVFVVQCLAAFPVAYFYGNQQLVLPICTLALVYLMYPFFLVQSAMIERENRLKIRALGSAIQSFVNNLITVVLALLGMGLWSIVWAMVLSTPILIIINQINYSWQPPKSFKLEQWQQVSSFGTNMLGVELLNKLRFNMDYLIVGKFLSIEQLGIYYFAFNAGVGITSNIVYAFMSALYPHICAVKDDYQQLKKRYFSSLKSLSIFVVIIVSLQTFLAPFYVPIIFGEKWVKATPVLMIICVSVIPLSFRWASSTLFKAIDKTHLMLYFDVIYTAIFGIALIAAVKWGVLWVAITVLVTHSLMSLAFNIWAVKCVFSKDKFFAFSKS
ncbi:lipopolysaccharide biosynthesis protein [Anabaena subtropica]|uniref:Lipopolysaccharide biosynthesis protein n=1 Tax=Anabaena subtropica FACHB-260 TaxID=2692884 RepID=A0ABR8CS98_9NOST|nr:lipopolysaccharide biosynthesis protein [Anabaena subtropica]MBD2345350.1 lipopolysaccharide biosynthesis protein [Anabaena subtropica FACHB-260]